MTAIGDKNRFALAFEALPDPDAAGTPEARASWARLEIWVAGRHLTAALSESGSQVQGAEVPLGPLVAWLLDNWDALFHEERLPRPLPCPSAAAWRHMSLRTLPDDEAEADELLAEREAWWQRHAIGSALPGFRIPDLHLRRFGPDVELSWTDLEWRTVPRGMNVMEAPGAATLPAEEVARTCFDFAAAIVDLVAASGTAPHFVAHARIRLDAIERPERAVVERRLLLAAGQRAGSAAVRSNSSVVTAKDTLPDHGAWLASADVASSGIVTSLPVPVLMFRSARPSLSDADQQCLLQLANDRSLSDGKLEPWQRATRLPPDDAEVTEQGYQLALRLRDQLQLPGVLPLVGDCDLEHVLLARLGVDLVDVELDDAGIDGVAAKSAGRRGVIAVNASGPFAASRAGRRTTIAHELCHLLFDIDERGVVGVVSNPWAPYAAERRANAFAVMLLLPDAALLARLPRDTRQWSPSLLHGVMREMGVGKSLLTWHLHNRGWISRSEREAWLDKL